MYIVDLASGMRHAGRFDYPPALAKSVVTRVGISLQDTAIVRQMLLWMDTFEVGRVKNHTAAGMVEPALRSSRT